MKLLDCKLCESMDHWSLPLWGAWIEKVYRLRWIKEGPIDRETGNKISNTELEIRLSNLHLDISNLLI